MPLIATATVALVDVEVETVRTDAVQSFAKQETIVVEVTTDEGLTGHFLMELHVSLVAAVPNGRYVEHIPQLRAITTQEMEIVDGHALAPEAPGLGIAWNRDAMDDRRVA
jgi:L-alanine-DL-glutamate epimerase-like enolase superfamily enzyme